MVSTVGETEDHPPDPGPLSLRCYESDTHRRGVQMNCIFSDLFESCRERDMRTRESHRICGLHCKLGAPASSSSCTDARRGELAKAACAYQLSVAKRARGGAGNRRWPGLAVSSIAACFFPLAECTVLYVTAFH